MTRSQSAIVAVILLCEVALAAPAYAECAWVLWGEYFKMDAKRSEIKPSTWEVYGGFTNREPCEREKLSKINEHVRRTQSITPEQVDATGFPGARYVCRPDTIDPRGPKGK